MKKSKSTCFVLVAAGFCVAIVSSLCYFSSIFPFSDDNFPLDKKWSRQLGEKITDISLSQKGIVLANTTRSIVALEIDDGDTLWSKQLNMELKPFPIWIGNNALYFLDNNSIWAFELETGMPLWSQPLLRPQAHILDVSEDYVVVNSLSTSITAYDTQTGELLWDLPARRGYVQAFIDKNKVYVLGDEIREVNAETGSVLWTENLDIKGEGLYDNGVMYFAGGDPFNMSETSLVAFDVINRKELWRTNIITQEVTDFLLHHDTLLLLDQEKIYALNKSHGDLNWEARVASPTNPVIVDNDAFVMEGFTRIIKALDLNSGKIVGSLHVSWPHILLSDSQSMVSHKNMLLFSKDSKIFAYGN